GHATTLGQTGAIPSSAAYYVTTLPRSDEISYPSLAPPGSLLLGAEKPSMPPPWMARGPRGPLPRLHPLTPANTGGSVNPRSRGLPAAHIGGPLRAKLESIHPVLMSRDVSASVRFYTRLGFSMTFQDRPID